MMVELTIQDRARKAYTDQEGKRKRKLLNKARKGFSIILKSSPDECQIKQDYWGEYVFIKANGLVFRYSEHRKENRFREEDKDWWLRDLELHHDLRLGKEVGRFRKHWRWSTPILDLTELAKQLDDFQWGLFLVYHGPSISPYP